MQLVVLSACKTGLGDVCGRARAPRGCARLFSVRERGRSWRLYGKGQALGDSDLALLKNFREKEGVTHPYFWGGFSLTGRAEQ